jgi:hypothetical protein
MTKKAKQKNEMAKNETKEIKPDPIIIHKESDDSDEESLLVPRASKFIDKTGHPSEEWVRMNEILYIALDYADSMPFRNDILKQIRRCYRAFSSGKAFNTDFIFDMLSKVDLDPNLTSFRRLMGEKLDEYLLAKKSTRK